MDKSRVTEWGKDNTQGRGFKLNLQHFADGENGGEGGNKPNPQNEPDGMLQSDGEEGGEGGKKTYTQAELDIILQRETDKRVTEALKTAKDKWSKEYEKILEDEKKEAERLAKLSAEEREKDKFAKERKAFEAERAQFERDRLEMQVAKELTNEGLDAEFASILMGADADTSMENIKTFKASFDKAVEAAVKARLAGRTPESGSGNGLTTNPFSKEGYNLTKQAELYRTNRELYNELKKQAEK